MECQQWEDFVLHPGRHISTDARHTLPCCAPLGQPVIGVPSLYFENSMRMDQEVEEFFGVREMLVKSTLGLFMVDDDNEVLDEPTLFVHFVVKKTDENAQRTYEHHRASIEFPVKKIKAPDGVLFQYWDLEPTFKTFTRAADFLNEESYHYESHWQFYNDCVLYPQDMLERNYSYYI